MKITCSRCGQHLALDDSAGGQAIACPCCAAKLSVPFPADSGGAARAADPNYVEALTALAGTLSADGKYEEASARLSEALEIDPGSALARNNLGAILFAQGKYDDARRRFLEAIRLDPAYLEAHLNLGSLLATEKRFDEAIPYFRRALDIDPSDKKARDLLDKAQAAQRPAPR